MQSPSRRCRAVVAATVALGVAMIGFPSVAVAVEPSVKEQVDVLNAQAVEKFEAKEYEEAVELFEQAYDLQPEPNYLFNIGRIYEESGNLEKAVEYYERFVKEPAVPLESREQGLERLRVLRAILKETAPEDEPEPEEEPEPDEEPEPEPEPEPDEEPEPERDKLRIAGYALIGAGGAGLATGGVLAGLALARNNELVELHTLEQRDATASQGRGMALGADILFGVGGAMVTAGLVMVIVSVKRSKQAAGKEAVARHPSVSPWASRRAAGASLTLSF